MQNITSIAGLKNAIELLEVEQTVKSQLLKEQFYLAYESLKPINLFRNALKEFFGAPLISENLSGTAVGAASGFLLKKIFVGRSGNILRRIIGSVLQFGVTNILAKNSEVIMSIVQSIFQQFVRSKK
jgi:hypothetical protein